MTRDDEGRTDATTPEPSRAAKAVTPRFLESVRDRLERDRPVRRSLPIWGRIHVDRRLPFLCVYRRPPNGRAGGTEKLVSSEASYVLSSGAQRAQAPLERLVDTVTATLAEPFGAFLVLEVWEAAFDTSDEDLGAARLGVASPRFRIVLPEGAEEEPHVTALRRALADVRVDQMPAHVEVVRRPVVAPPGFRPVVAEADARARNVALLGLEVRPVHRHPETGEPYPMILRALRRALTGALRRAFHEFCRTRTAHCPAHVDMLGRRAVVKAVWDVDARLSEVSSAFDLLLQISPINAEDAWRAFRHDRGERAPPFRYRPLPVDPVLLKRRLFQVPIERVEDPVLHQIFREKQDELDRRLNLLLEANTARFAPASVLLYGRPSADEVERARSILDAVPVRTRDDAGPRLDAAAIVRRAKREFAHYRAQWPEFDATVRLRRDIAGGLMMSRGALLVSRSARIPAVRADALLQHEIGTHVVTYHNGRAQPFRQLRSGLAGYESLQEGLAVLAEYLVGGLSRPRLRLLAARVVAVHAMLEGASFVETVRSLTREHGFGRRTAFQIALRVHRGGGFTKDAVYLRGLAGVLAHLAAGGALEPLLVGRIAARHAPIVEELQLRGVLRAAPLRPRFLDAPGAAARLDRARRGLSILDLAAPPPTDGERLA